MHFLSHILGSKTLVPDVLKDMAKHARRKSIVYKKDPHPSLIPASVNTIEKIIDRCHEKVTQSLLDTLKHLPNKPVKFEKLPQVVLEELEKQGLISIPQNYGDILLDYKRRQSSVATIRLTKSSLDDSVSKLSENTKGAASHKHSTRKSGAAAANLIQVSSKLCVISISSLIIYSKSRTSFVTKYSSNSHSKSQ